MTTSSKKDTSAATESNKREKLCDYGDSTATAIEAFKAQVLEGIPDSLPEPQQVDPGMQ